jgi:hypothetical protein
MPDVNRSRHRDGGHILFDVRGAAYGCGARFCRRSNDLILHILRKIGLSDLLSAAERGSTTARSSDLNHLAKIVTGCIRIIPRDNSVSFDFAEFTNVALSFIGTSCAVSDVLESMRKVYSIPGNDLLSLVNDGKERIILGELLRKGGELQIIPCL